MTPDQPAKHDKVRAPAGARAARIACLAQMKWHVSRTGNAAGMRIQELLGHRDVRTTMRYAHL